MKVRLEVSESEGKLSLLLPDEVAVGMGLKHGDRVKADSTRWLRYPDGTDQTINS